MQTKLRFSLVVSTLALIGSVAANAAPITFSASGSNAVSIQATVDAFRASLGTLNANTAGSVGSGRREISWDGVPDAFSAPNNLPANFFNVNSPRGVVLSTPGTGFQVSANAGNPTPIQFSNIDPSYISSFEPFSAQKLFTALGSTITDVNFFVPGSATPAFTTAFGAVFSDVDLANITSLQFFDPKNVSLGTFFVPNFAGTETFSFLGVQTNAHLPCGLHSTQALATARAARDQHNQRNEHQQRRRRFRHCAWLSEDEIVHDHEVLRGVTRSEHLIAAGDTHAAHPFSRIELHAEEGERLVTRKIGDGESSERNVRGIEELQTRDV